MPSIEKVRLVSSGTEATMSAIRLARGFTGRDVIVKFAGNYHGHVDSLLVAAGSSRRDARRAQLAGRDRRHDRATRSCCDTTTSPAWTQAFAEHGARIAGVILEPVVGNMGCVVPTPRVPARAARADAAARRAADLRRSDDRLPRGVRRGAGAVTASSPT